MRADASPPPAASAAALETTNRSPCCWAASRSRSAASIASPTAAAASAHDTIYALDRFHAVAGTAIASAGGVQCRQTGDGWMALFGLDGGGLEAACRQALAAARQIEERADALAQRLVRELGLDAGFSVGVDAGLVVAGMIGDGETRRLAAVGEVIDAAERLRDAARQQGERFVVSKAAADAAGGGDAAPPLPSDASAHAVLPTPHGRTPTQRSEP